MMQVDEEAANAALHLVSQGGANSHASGDGLFSRGKKTFNVTSMHSVNIAF